VTKPRPKRLSQGFAAIIGLGLIGLCVVLVMLWPKPAPQEVLDSPATAPPVTVLTVEAGPHQARVRVNAVVQPRYDLTIRSEINAPVRSVPSQTLPGQRLEAGTVIAELDDTALRAQLAEAHNRLASAELSLSLAEQESEQAISAWNRSGETTPPPPLVARQPQVRAAQMETYAARAALAEAQRQLSETEIRAPISGVISDRYVAPGAQLAAGDPVLRLQHDDLIDIPVQVSASDFRYLDTDIETLTAELILLSNGTHWPAEVRAISGVMDNETRQMTLYLERQQSTTRLRPGSIVEAVISGQIIENGYRVPESAFTRDGVVWVVREDNRLDRIQAHRLFLDDGFVVLRLPDSETAPLQIALHPVSSFTRGQRVTRHEEE